MKWLNDILANTKTWFDFLSGLAVHSTNEPDETAIINDYFATYLQKMAADRIKPISGESDLLYKKHSDTCDANFKHPETPLRALSPLKQVI